MEHVCAKCGRIFTSDAQGFVSHRKDDGTNDFELDKDHEPEDLPWPAQLTEK